MGWYIKCVLTNKPIIIEYINIVFDSMVRFTTNKKWSIVSRPHSVDSFATSNVWFCCINSSMAQTFGIDRQPTKLDYASPTQFKFSIVQLPKVEFFTTAANLPSITLADAIFPTPFTDIPVQGDKLTFDNLIISFIVDESLENYIQLHKWLYGIGFPISRQQFTEFRADESVTPTATRGVSTDIGDVKPATPSRGLFGDATLTVLSNKNNPLVEVRFRDVYPASLSGLDYNQNNTDVEYLTATCDFKYTLYEIITI